MAKAPDLTVKRLKATLRALDAATAEYLASRPLNADRNVAAQERIMEERHKVFEAIQHAAAVFEWLPTVLEECENLAAYSARVMHAMEKVPVLRRQPHQCMVDV